LAFWSHAGFRIGGHAFAPALAAEAGFLVAAEADGGVEVVGRVDPDDAGLEFRRDIEGEVDVLAPDGGGEAVARCCWRAATASSGVRKLIATSTGPKISTRGAGVGRRDVG
jgi:hypothetical protein